METVAATIGILFGLLLGIVLLAFIFTPVGLILCIRLARKFPRVDAHVRRHNLLSCLMVAMGVLFPFIWCVIVLLSLVSDRKDGREE